MFSWRLLRILYHSGRPLSLHQVQNVRKIFVSLGDTLATSFVKWQCLSTHPLSVFPAVISFISLIATTTTATTTNMELLNVSSAEKPTSFGDLAALSINDSEDFPVPPCSCGGEHIPGKHYHSSHSTSTGDDSTHPFTAKEDESSGEALGPMEEKASSQPSIVFPVVKPPHSDAWSNLSKQVWKKSNGVEILMKFEEASSDDIDRIANKVAKNIRPWFEREAVASVHHMQRVMDITENLRAFRWFCEEHLKPDTIRGYKIKLAARHGQAATQCPAWHTDYVPIRFLQTLLGPGSLYIAPENYSSSTSSSEPMIQHVLINQRPPELDNHPEWKEAAVKTSKVGLNQAETGQPIMLVGNQWREVAKQEYKNIQTVLHRSPHNVPKQQGRVLMTLDVLVE